MAEVLHSIPGYDEGIPAKTIHNNVYPFIDPTASYEKQSLKGKVALITGASSGIGQAIAIGLARAGASLAIAARRQSELNETKEAALAGAPHANIITFVLDVRDTDAAADAVARTVAEFGQLDILIPNAGTSTPDTLNIHEVDPAAFWNTFEVNFKGVFNFVRAAIPHLNKSHGRIVSMGSEVAHWRIPNLTGYALSKMAVERFAETLTYAYPDIKSFVIHPGLIATKMTIDNVSPAALDRELEKVDLPVALIIYLLEGKADWLNGRFFNAIWDIEEVEREWKDKILEQNGLVMKLHVPK